ncbi:MAG: hypothetical protein CL668_03150 [Balneola sp.]|nr:hypothetical protein [Balneola sp.]
MKVFKIIALTFSVALYTATIFAQETKLIPLTTNSEKALELMRTVMANAEEFRGNDNPPLLEEILRLDPNFYYAKTYNSLLLENNTYRTNLNNAYENRSNVSEIEEKIIEATYQQYINLNTVLADKIIDDLVSTYPDYYQLRLLSADLKNDLMDPYAKDIRYAEILEQNPKSFPALFRRAQLHFPVDNDIVNFPIEERDLELATSLLLQAASVQPKNPGPQRFLGNVYRGQNNLRMAKQAYESSRLLLGEPDEIDFRYSNILLMLGHVETFSGNYKDARKLYDNSIEFLNFRQKPTYFQFPVFTYFYERDYEQAIISFSKMRSEINTSDQDQEWKTENITLMEENIFVSHLHNSNEQGANKSLQQIAGFKRNELNSYLTSGASREQLLALKNNNDIYLQELRLWKDIIFGASNVEQQLNRLKTLLEKNLAQDPNAMTLYHKYSGYAAIMAGDDQAAIRHYSVISNIEMDDDNYHSYFYAIALRGSGDTEKSSAILKRVAENTFATRGAALVQMLAKRQL